MLPVFKHNLNLKSEPIEWNNKRLQHHSIKLWKRFWKWAITQCFFCWIVIFLYLCQKHITCWLFPRIIVPNHTSSCVLNSHKWTDLVQPNSIQPKFLMIAWTKNNFYNFIWTGLGYPNQPNLQLKSLLYFPEKTKFLNLFERTTLKLCFPQKTVFWVCIFLKNNFFVSVWKDR